MKNRPIKKVTVGLPVYNGGASIERAIQCWLGQDFTDFELIVSDNGSTDQTFGICEKYCRQDDRIQYYRFPQNMGMARSFERLVNMACGDYFVFAFHNDIFAPTYLSSCIDVLDNDPSVVLCYTGTGIIDSDDNYLYDATDQFLLDQESLIDRYKQLLANLGLCNCFHGLIRKNILLQTIPFDICAAGDVTLLAKLILKGKFFQIPEELCKRSEPTHQHCKSLNERWSHIERWSFPHRPHRDFCSTPFFDIITAMERFICETDFADEDKEELLRSTYDIVTTRYKKYILWEIGHLLTSIHNGNLRYIWKDESFSKKTSPKHLNISRAYLIQRYIEVDRLINYFKEMPDLYYVAGVLLYRLNRYEEAKNKIEIAIHKKRDHMQALQLLNRIEQSLLQRN